MHSRYAAIMIALCLLVGIASFSSLLSGATGVPAGEDAPLPNTTSVPPINSSTAGALGAAGPSPDQADTDTNLTPTLTPTVTPTEYIEKDSTVLTGAPAPSPSLPATSLATTLPTTVPSTTIETAASTQTPARTVPDTTAKVPLSASDSTSITAHLRVLNEVFSPSSIIVPAGARVTIVFDNQDVDIPHNVVIYDLRDMPTPVFVGTVIKGPGRITDTFTAPSTPGTYMLGCGIPSPHPKGTFIVE